MGPTLREPAGPAMSRTVYLVIVLLHSLLPAGAAGVEFESDIKPLLTEKCGSCHGVLRQEAGLRLDAGKFVHVGGDSGEILNLQSPQESELVRRVISHDASDRMPPPEEGTPLDSQQIEKLVSWIRLGATIPDEEEILLSPTEHWSFQLPQRPEMPPPTPAPWNQSPIDALLYAKWEQVGLAPVPAADPRTRLRRLYFDLTGMPPTLDQQKEWLANPSPQAWLETVTRLLNDPAYGERWGRHWMDVWRYSDWDGYREELRGSQRHIWHWRDWIIESLNHDQGYDQMIREMLAADELAPEDTNTLRATGYLARNFHKSNRDIWLDATVEHSAKAFLGLTVACARCHDHKYDPISQRDYYAIRAVFEPHKIRTDLLPGQLDPMKGGLPRAYDAELEVPTYLYLRGNEKHPDKDNPVQPGVLTFVSAPFEVQPIELPTTAHRPFLRPFIESEQIALAEKQRDAAATALAKRRAQEAPETDTAPQANDGPALQAQLAESELNVAQHHLDSLQARWSAHRAQVAKSPDAKALAKTASLAEREYAAAQAKRDLLKHQVSLAGKEPDDTAKKKLTELDKKLADATKRLDEPNEQFTPVGESYPATSTGRRTAFANWIANTSNPLTARVAVNHVWLRYFGEPLVPNVFDFGLKTPRPIQADLLDWLACELMENQWSLKHLHQLITTSHAYQLSSSALTLDESNREANLERDRDNHYFWRANVRRLDAEVIRDSLLCLSGRLDRTTGGPDLDFKLGETVPRRSIYFRHAYEKQMQMLVTFDAASPTECYRRSDSVVPQQALALANSPLAFDQSRHLAARLNEQASTSQEFIRDAFAIVLQRDATEEEVSACDAFLVEQTQLLSQQEKLTPAGGSDSATVAAATDAGRRAQENLIHVLINHNDFVTLR